MRNRDAVIIPIVIVLFLLLAALFIIFRPAYHDQAGASTAEEHTSQTESPIPTAKPTPPQKRPPAPTPTPRTNTTIVTPHPAATPGTGRKNLTPEPDTDGFYHPEDFYDWYKDDFIDYEDAEDYYYSHGGW